MGEKNFQQRKFSDGKTFCFHSRNVVAAVWRESLKWEIIEIKKIMQPRSHKCKKKLFSFVSKERKTNCNAIEACGKNPLIRDPQTHTHEKVIKKNNFSFLLLISANGRYKSLL